MASSIGKKEIQMKLDPKYGRINPSKRFLSEPMLHYILKYGSPKTYLKRIQVSKYFLVNEFPQIKRFKVIRCLHNSKNIEHITEIGEDEETSEIIGKRLWISTNFFIWDNYENDVARYLEGVYRCDIINLCLKNQTLTYDELKILMESDTIETLRLITNTFTHSNGDPVDIEDILVMIPMIRKIHYYPNDSHFTFTSQKTAALPIFKNLDNFFFYVSEESFDCFAFCDFVKKTQLYFADLSFNDNVSISFQRDLQKALKSIPSSAFTQSDPSLVSRMYFREYNQHCEIRRVISRKRVFNP